MTAPQNETAKPLDVEAIEARIVDLGLHDRDSHAFRALCARVRELESECRKLARLASPKPEFFNPLEAWEAEAIRDKYLAANPGVSR